MANFGRDVARAGEPVYIWTYGGLATCACRLCKNNISIIPGHQGLNEHISWNDLMFTRCLKIYEHILEVVNIYPHMIVKSTSKDCDFSWSGVLRIIWSSLPEWYYYWLLYRYLERTCSINLPRGEFLNKCTHTHTHNMMPFMTKTDPHWYCINFWKACDQRIWFWRQSNVHQGISHVNDNVRLQNVCLLAQQLDCNSRI